MNPKEKARELLDKIEGTLGGSLPTGDDIYFPETKQCALIAIDEILDILENRLDFKMLKSMALWTEVKQEIEKL